MRQCNNTKEKGNVPRNGTTPTVFSGSESAGEAQSVRDISVTLLRQLVPFLRISKWHQGWLPPRIKNNRRSAMLGRPAILLLIIFASLLGIVSTKVPQPYALLLLIIAAVLVGAAIVLAISKRRSKGQ